MTFRRYKSNLLAMFRSVYDGALPPPEEEVPESHPQHEREAEPHVVRHEHQHEDVRSRGLYNV